MLGLYLEFLAAYLSCQNSWLQFLIFFFYPNLISPRHLWGFWQMIYRKETKEVLTEIEKCALLYFLYIFLGVCISQTNKVLVDFLIFWQTRANQVLQNILRAKKSEARAIKLCLLIKEKSRSHALNSTEICWLS